MNKTKILITTVGGVTSPDIIKSLKKKNIYIYGVDKNKNAVGKFFVNKFLLMPDSKNNKLKFIKKIVSIIKNGPPWTALICVGPHRQLHGSHAHKHAAVHVARERHLHSARPGAHSDGNMRVTAGLCLPTEAATAQSAHEAAELLHAVLQAHLLLASDHRSHHAPLGVGQSR